MSIDTQTRVTTEKEFEDVVDKPARGSRNNQPPPRPKRKPWGLLVMAVLLVAGYFVYKKVGSGAPAPPKPAFQPGAMKVQVAVSAARVGDIPVYLNALGSVTPFNTVTVKSRIDGQLLKVAFKEGQFVKAGASLAEIDPRPFQVQLAQADAQLARDQASLSNANLDLARYQKLSREGVVTQQQLDTQQATVNQDSALIKADQAQIDNARLQLVYCHITAPIGGRVGLRQLDVGNQVHAADQNGLVVITQIEPIVVIFTIPEDNLRQVLEKLKSGQHLETDAYDRSGQTKLATGRLLTVDNEIDPATGTSRLKAVFDNKDKALFPNQFVNIRLLVETQKSQVLIPASAIQRGPQGSTYVYVVKDMKAQRADVKVGTIEGNDAAIESGVSEGDQIVTDGTDKLRPDSPVTIAGAPSKGRGGAAQ